MSAVPAHPAAQRWGALSVVAASVLWGTTGTAATFAPGVSPLAIGAVAMGAGGLLQALVAARRIAGRPGAGTGSSKIRSRYRTSTVPSPVGPSTRPRPKSRPPATSTAGSPDCGACRPAGTATVSRA